MFFSLLLKTKRRHKEIKTAVWSFYFQAHGSSSFSSLGFTVLILVTSFSCWPWAADWQSAVCIPATLEGRSNTAPDKQAAGNLPSAPPVLNIYKHLFSWLDYQGQKNVHPVIQTFCHHCPSYSFSLFWATVIASGLLHPFLVLTFPRLPTVFSPKPPPSNLPFSIILSTSHSITYCSFVLNKTLGLNKFKKL